MKKFLPSFLFLLTLLVIGNIAFAETSNVNLTVKNNGNIVYSGDITLLPAGTVNLNDSDGNSHETNANSVLSVINTADTLSTEFDVSSLIYYNLFSAFYLKCIDISTNKLCDNWQYKVNGISPNVGMDSEILSGGENIVLYFGDENPIPEPLPEPIPEPLPEPIAPTHGGGGGQMALNIVSTALPPVLPTLNSPTPIPENIIPEEKPNIQEDPIKPAPNPKKTVKKIKNKLANLATQNTATVINTLEQNVVEPAKKNWFKRLLDRLFSVF